MNHCPTLFIILISLCLSSLSWAGSRQIKKFTPPPAFAVAQEEMKVLARDFAAALIEVDRKPNDENRARATQVLNQVDQAIRRVHAQVNLARKIDRSEMPHRKTPIFFLRHLKYQAIAAKHSLGISAFVTTLPLMLSAMIGKPDVQNTVTFLVLLSCTSVAVEACLAIDTGWHSIDKPLLKIFIKSLRETGIKTRFKLRPESLENDLLEKLKDRQACANLLK